MGDNAGAVVGGTIGFMVGGPGGAAVGASIGGGVDSYRHQRTAASAQRRQARAQERAERAQSRMAQAEQQREIQRNLAQRRIQRAAILSRSEAEGVGDSAGVFGAISSLGSQTAEGLGNVGRNLQTGEYITRQNIAAGRAGSQASTAMGKAAMSQTISQTAGNIFQMTGGYENLFSGSAQSMPTAEQITSPIQTPIQPRR